MNDLVRQLLSVSPALGAGVSGNGEAMQAFMDGYQRTMAQLETQKRAQTRDQLDQQELQMRQQTMTQQTERQGRMDAQAEEERRRRRAMEGLQVPGTLAEQGAMMDSPEQAKALIESMMPNVMQAFGQESMAFGQPAVEMATQAITGRQKKQVEAFVEQAMKTSYVADNPNADPELVELPEHIARIVGKPSAHLSELQRFAALPVGRPAGKPSDVPSLQSRDMLVNGRLTPVNFNPKTGTYTDQSGKPVVVDAVPPREPAGSGNADDTRDTAQQLVDGFLVPSMLSRRGNYNAILAEANRLSKAQTGKPYNAARAQTEYAASQRFMAALNGPQQQRFRALAGSVVNTIDEVKELSRELQNSGVPLANRAKLVTYTQTMGNTPEGQLAARYLGAVNTLKEEFANLAQGGYAPTEDAWDLANQQINGDFGVKQMDAALTEVQRLINYRMQAFEALTPYGVGPTNPAVAGMGVVPPTRPADGGPRIGERRKFGSVLGEWDGAKWVEVRP